MRPGACVCAAAAVFPVAPRLMRAKRAKGQGRRLQAPGIGATAGAGVLPNDFQNVLLISCIAVLAPLVSRAPWLVNVPAVAIEVALGMAVGPSGAALVANDGIVEFLARMGLAFLFFEAGFELKHKDIGAESLRLGLIAWSASLAVAALCVSLFYAVGLVDSPALIVIALSTTSVGIVLAVVRRNAAISPDLKRCVLGAAAIGEIGPLLLASIAFAQDHRRLEQVVVTLAFLAIAVGCVFLFSHLKSEKISSMILRWLGDHEILPVRIALLLMMGLVYLANLFGIEMVVGAYVAGLAISTLVEGTEAQILEDRLMMIGSGFFVPVFFIAAGVELDLSTLASGPASMARILAFCLLLLFIRAAPLHLYRRTLDKGEWPAFALLASITLPLVVAIAYMGARKGQMSADTAAALVGAAVITVTIFPTLALSSCARRQASRPPGAVDTWIQRSSDWTVRQAERIPGLRRRF